MHFLTSLFCQNIFKFSITFFSESTNAIILWTEMEYIGTNKSSLILSTGLLEDCKIEAGPKWHRGHRQGVYFLPQKNKLDIIKGIKISFNLYE